jgi:uncharacterized membrane protein
MSVTSDLDRTIARLLTAGTFLSVGLLAIGVVLMATTGTSPLAPSPPFDISRIPAQIAALEPAGFLWLGLIVAIATPLARVAAAVVGYLRGGERRMALVGIAILLVVAVGVVIGVTTER